MPFCKSPKRLVSTAGWTRFVHITNGNDRRQFRQVGLRQVGEAILRTAFKRVVIYKYLGAVFHSKLNWKESINSVVKKKKSELENVLLEKAEIFWIQFRCVITFFFFFFFL